MKKLYKHPLFYLFFLLLGSASECRSMFKQALNPSSIEKIQDEKIIENNIKQDSYGDCLEPGPTNVFPYNFNTYKVKDDIDKLLEKMQKTADKKVRLNLLVDFVCNKLKKEISGKNDQISGFGKFLKYNWYTVKKFKTKIQNSINLLYSKEIDKQIEIGAYFKPLSILKNSKFNFFAKSVIQNTSTTTKKDLIAEIDNMKSLFKDSKNNPNLSKIGDPLFAVLDKLYPLKKKSRSSKASIIKKLLTKHFKNKPPSWFHKFWAYVKKYGFKIVKSIYGYLFGI